MVPDSLISDQGNRGALTTPIGRSRRVAGMSFVHLILVIVASAVPPSERVHHPFAHRVGEFAGPSRNRLKACLTFYRNWLAYSCPVGQIQG